MLSRLKSAGLVWPSVLAALGLAVLISLGTWQMQRKVWKDGLVAQIKARTVAAPVPIEDAAARLGRGEDIEYLRVRLSGELLNDHERYLYAPDAKLGPGFHVLTPVIASRRADCRELVFVNRGWVPDALKPPLQRALGQVAQARDLVGLVRLPERPGSFTPANDVAKNIWFWRDVAALRASLPPQALGKPCGQAGPMFAFIVDAESLPANPGGWPRGGTTRLEIPNRHLEYAITWYGLAATLIGVFAAFAAGRLRKAG